ncbi:MAG: hypothetical protein K2P86_10920 [Xanthobacteraceae bacterium]|nr:hypothetical protein [Xanthobacteraceae bacterium]
MVGRPEFLNAFPNVGLQVIRFDALPALRRVLHRDGSLKRKEMRIASVRGVMATG